MLFYIFCKCFMQCVVYFYLYHFVNRYMMPHSAGVSHTPKMDRMSWLALSPSPPPLFALMPWVFALMPSQAASMSSSNPGSHAV